MNPQAAGELVHLWLLAHDEPAAVAQQRGPVSRAVRELAPDAAHVGVGHTPTGPIMAVLLESALIVLQANPLAADSHASTPVRARLLQLDPAVCGLEVTERFEDRGDVPLRVHVWQLRAGGLELQFVGRETMHAGVEATPDATEALSRSIAAKLGWVLP